MDKDLAKSLRQTFARHLADELPQFEPQGGKGGVSRPGARSYLWSVADDLHFFVCLSVDADHDKFHVEGGWNSAPTYPEKCTPRSFADKDVIQEKAALLCKMKKGAKTPDAWKADAKEVDKHILEALTLIKQEFLPVFSQRAKAKGIKI